VLPAIEGIRGAIVPLRKLTGLAEKEAAQKALANAQMAIRYRHLVYYAAAGDNDNG
jgi:hypothetical protein